MRDRGRENHVTVAVSLAMLLAAMALAVGWVGFIASDDQYYYSAALKWLEQGWYLPDHFGRVRNSVSLPIAGSIRLFGDHELAIIIPSVVYYLATLVLTFLGLSRVTDRKTAFLACALFATFPVVVTAATTASGDIWPISRDACFTPTLCADFPWPRSS